MNRQLSAFHPPNKFCLQRLTTTPNPSPSRSRSKPRAARRTQPAIRPCDRHNRATGTSWNEAQNGVRRHHWNSSSEFSRLVFSVNDAPCDDPPALAFLADGAIPLQSFRDPLASFPFLFCACCLPGNDAGGGGCSASW